MSFFFYAFTLQYFKLSIKDAEKSFIERLPTKNFNAFLKYLEGKFYLQGYGTDVQKSILLLQTAVQLDDQFADGWSALAQAYIKNGIAGILSIDETLSQNIRSAKQALTVDAFNLPAFHALAYACMAYEWGWPEIEPVFQKVMGLSATQGSSLQKFQRCRDQIFVHLEEMKESGQVTTLPNYLSAYFYLHRGEFVDQRTLES